jgi:hypothetical protein
MENTGVYGIRIFDAYNTDKGGTLLASYVVDSCKHGSLSSNAYNIVDEGSMRW